MRRTLPEFLNPMATTAAFGKPELFEVIVLFTLLRLRGDALTDFSLAFAVRIA